jgi:glyoxylase-like metal-dependent hydrolase (beta-lactamase superfamily II)
VATAIDPKHLYLPLPGGRHEAHVSVEPLRCGEVLVPPSFYDRPRGRLWQLRAFIAARSRWFWVPVPVFLVRHPTAGAMLIDTGFHPSVAVDPKQNLGAVAGRVQKVRMAHDDAVMVQLEQRGLTRRDIRVIVMTHLHTDHASGISEFPDATFVVDRAEWDAASAGGLLQGYDARHFDHAFDWRAVDFASREVDSFASFGHAANLFGDGSVRLFSTPGHSAGHMSVLLRLREHELLVCGDALYSRASLDEDLLPLFRADEHRYVRSRAEIRRFAEQTPSAVIVPGHDPEAWETLDSRYE